MKKVILFLLFSFLYISPSIAGLCDFIYEEKITVDFPLAYGNEGFKKKWESYLYYERTFNNLKISTYCPADSGFFQQYIEEIRKEEARSMMRAAVSSMGEQLLIDAGVNNLLKFDVELRFDEFRFNKFVKKKDGPKEIPKTDAPTNISDKIDQPINTIGYKLARDTIRFLDSLKLEDDLHGNIILGDRVGIGLRYQNNYIESSYNVFTEDVGFLYRTFLLSDGSFNGVISVGYTNKYDSLFNGQGNVQVLYTILF